MSDIVRLRFELNRGRRGVPLYKFASVMGECKKFLELFFEDINIDYKKGQWLVCNLEDGSAIGDIEYVGEVTVSQEKDYSYEIERILSNPKGSINGKIRRKTVIQYMNIADTLDPDEDIGFGIYKDDKTPQIYDLTKKDAIELKSEMEGVIEYFGSIQGEIHDFNKGADPPFFKLRDNASKRLIKCYFNVKKYDEVVALLQKRDAVVIVTGLISASKAERRIEDIKIRPDDRIQLAPEYKDGDLEKFIGCAPGILGRKTLQEYIDEIRERNG